MDPTARGFGVVVLEGLNRLVDGGLKSIRKNKEEATFLAIAELISLYAPHVVVLENAADASSRRGRRVRNLIRDLSAVARTKWLDTKLVPVSAVHEASVVHGARTKHDIAGVIAARFAELMQHRPRFRKPWMSEDERQAIFDATAFELAFQLASWA